VNSRLQPREVEHQLELLRPHLTTMQATRLAEIAGVLDDDGRFRLREALEVAEFSGPDTRAQDTFQDFRQRVNNTAERAGIDLRLELDPRKTTPDRRHGWFSGGDLVEKGIVAFSEDAAGRTGIDRPVAPEVAELGEPTTRLYVSHTVTPGSARRINALLVQLRESLGADAERKWEISDAGSVPLGEDVANVRDRLSAEADVRVALLSPAYLLDRDERRRTLEQPGPLVAFAFSGLPDGPVDLSPLQPHDVQRHDKPWDELSRTEQRKDYVNNLIREIRRALSPRPAVVPERAADDLVIHWTTEVARRRRGDDSRHLVPSELTETTLQESQLDPSHRTAGPPLRAIERLVSWATDDRPGAPRLCALLGDVGMGKTTTAKLFTQHLVELRKKDAAVPLPILFDLRDVRVKGLAESMTLNSVLEGMLEATRPANVPRSRLNADVLRARLEKGDVVVIFDGLDEVLVHLSPHDQQLFTRQLWRALSGDSPTRMLLTCRTQYFRTIRDEVTYFTGESRQGLRGSDYLALLMLPFRDEQIREYLAGNLARGSEWVDTFLETIAAVHDLPDLTRRPITLRLIADQVEFIELAKLEGRTLRSVDIYGEVVERWIARDSGKHTLTPDHKRLLMEEIAAALWRSGQNSWSPAEVDDWLLDLLDQRPELERHYRERVPDLWKADFRTATFLKREGDAFEFSHRSLFEFFLARYLYRALSTSDFDVAAVAMPVPSPETLDFLGQSIAGDERTAVEALQQVAGEYVPLASELAFAYALHAEKKGYPGPVLAGFELTGAQLADWRIDGDGASLQLAGANFHRADLRGAKFSRVDLTGADLGDTDSRDAEFHDSQLTRSLWHGARTAGAILRGCRIDDVDFGRARNYRTQLVNCEPVPADGPGLRIAPEPGRVKAGNAAAHRLQPLVSHTAVISAVTWSPDSQRFLTGSFTGVRVWDALTCQALHAFGNDAGRVERLDWSDDGTLILIVGSSSVQIWDAATARLVRDFARPRKIVHTADWCPRTNRLLTGDSEGTWLWALDTGELLGRFANTGPTDVVSWSPAHDCVFTGGAKGRRLWHDAGRDLKHRLGRETAPLRAVAWSPDSAWLILSDDNSAHVWDTKTGRPTHELSRGSSPVTGAAWSPDGREFITLHAKSTARVWDARTGRVIRQIDDGRGSIKAVAWSPNGRRLATVTEGSAIQVRDARTGRSTHRYAGISAWVHVLAWAPDTTHVVTSGAAGVQVWSTTSGRPVRHWAGASGDSGTLAWSPDNSRILGARGNSARIWDFETGRTAMLLKGHRGAIRAVAWSPDGRHALTGTDQTARIWDVHSGETLRQLSDFTGSTSAVAWSPDGQYVLVGSGTSKTSIWDAGTGRLLRSFGPDNGLKVEAVGWSPDTKHVLTGSASGAFMWDAGTGRLVHHFDDHANVVGAVAWSPDNTRIITGGNDNYARIRDARTGETLHELGGHTEWLRAVQWSPDSRRVFTGSYDNTIRTWDAETGRPIGLVITALSDREYAVFDAESGDLVSCSKEAWRWLGWPTTENGQMDYLPAETFGPLPVVP
jgi:WD40 repeat protein